MHAAQPAMLAVPTMSLVDFTTTKLDFHFILALYNQNNNQIIFFSKSTLIKENLFFKKY